MLMRSQVQDEYKQKGDLPGHEKELWDFSLFSLRVQLFTPSFHAPILSGEVFKKHQIDIVDILCLCVQMKQNVQMNKTI